MSVYGQHTWSPTPRLSLTYGLRWEYNPPPDDGDLEGVLFVEGVDDPAMLQLAAPGTARWSAPTASFAPRLGIAYQLVDERGRETVLRGGAGVYYDLGTGPAGRLGYSNVAWLDLGGFPIPLTAEAIAGPPSFGANVSPPYGTLRPVTAFVTDLRLPRTYQVSLTLEQALGVDQTLSVSYVGAFGRELLLQQLLVAPNPLFARVNLVRNGSSSDYNALQAHFERRIANGLGALVSYTWSHAIDLVSSDQAPRRDTELVPFGLDRASASFDVRHALNAAATYDIPAPGESDLARGLFGDWTVSLFLRARSAFPVDVQTGGIPGFTVRPDVVPGEPFYVDDSAAPGGWRLNPDAFVAPSIGRQGSLGRNVVRGFRATQLDLALDRTFDLTERLELEFRGEVFNVLNHPSFASPVATLGTGARFGKSEMMLAQSLGGLDAVYQVGGPRSIQLALRLRF